jgi:hypothetical protein
MNPIKAIRNQVKLQEGSTKRGIAAFITGAVIVYMVFKGQPVDFDSILLTVSQSVEFWIGVGLNVTGLLGVFIPDEPKTVRIELPPIDLIGQAGISDADRADAVRRVAIDVAIERLHRQPVQSRPEAESAQPNNNWNG